jgi:hypothetical protein
MIFTLFLSLSVVFAQERCEGTNFQPCLDDNQQYRESTCDPLLTTSAKFYNDCLCYHYANEALCYQQCSDPSVQTELTTVQIPKTQNQCNAQGLNYLAYSLFNILVCLVQLRGRLILLLTHRHLQQSSRHLHLE